MMFSYFNNYFTSCRKLRRHSIRKFSNALFFSHISSICSVSFFYHLGVKASYVVLVLGAFTGAAHGGEIVFKPINPNFGGNPFNDGILLSAANAQNPYTAKRAERDLSEQFVRSLQSRLFSGLASQVQEAIFGDDPQ